MFFLKGLVVSYILIKNGKVNVPFPDSLLPINVQVSIQQLALASISSKNYSRE